MSDVLGAARAAWPEIVVDDAAFLAHVARKRAGLAEGATLRTEDLYFAVGCAQHDARALASFEALHGPMLVRVFARLRLPDATAEDLGAELREHLFFGRPDAPPLVLDYSGRGAFAAWLRAVAVHRAFKTKRNDRRDVGDSLGALVSDADPEHAYLRRASTVAFEAALDAAIRGLSARERNILRQHHLDGLGIDALGALYDVHRATAARWIADARRSILDSVRATLATSMSPSEVDSVLRATKDDLELRVSSILRAAD